MFCHIERRKKLKHVTSAKRVRGRQWNNILDNLLSWHGKVSTHELIHVAGSHSEWRSLFIYASQQGTWQTDHQTDWQIDASIYNYNHQLHMYTHKLPGKYVLVEIILYLFICNVYTQLLKWVCLEILKPKNVQQAHWKIFISERWGST